MSYILLIATGLIATVLGLIGYIFYIRSILSGKTKPSRMTWAILSGLSIIIAVTNFELEATITLGALIVSAICSTLIFILSLKLGVGGWETIDKITLLGLFASILIWLLFKNPLLTLLLALSFDFWALLPTIVKVRIDPISEESLPWIVTVASSFMNLLATNPFNLSTLPFSVLITPLYLAIINSVVLFYILKGNFPLTNYLNFVTSISRRTK